MRLEETFSQLKEAGRPAFMAHVYCGDPDIDFSQHLIETLADDIDILELGIPYSDPLADGNIFQRACQRALEGGVRVKDVFMMVKELRGKGFSLPIVLTTYYNIIYQAGPARFVTRLAEHQVQGVIVPDLPMEESHELQGECASRGIHLIYLIAPTTTEDRIEKIVKMASGFIYVVSFTGVTGSRKEADRALEVIVQKIRKKTALPLLVGFGISEPEQVQALRNVDGFIIGSANARLYAAPGSGRERLETVARFTSRFRRMRGCG